ncbi:Mom family adenine methylcarbamoylation protein [Bilophila wadsworthia]
MFNKGSILHDNADRALKLTYRQYRYILFLKQSWRKRLRLKVQPYPKPEA